MKRRRLPDPRCGNPKVPASFANTGPAHYKFGVKPQVCVKRPQPLPRAAASLCCAPGGSGGIRAEPATATDVQLVATLQGQAAFSVHQCANDPSAMVQPAPSGTPAAIGNCRTCRRPAP